MTAAEGCNELAKTYRLKASETRNENLPYDQKKIGKNISWLGEEVPLTWCVKPSKIEIWSVHQWIRIGNSDSNDTINQLDSDLKFKVWMRVRLLVVYSRRNSWFSCVFRRAHLQTDLCTWEWSNIVELIIKKTRSSVNFTCHLLLQPHINDQLLEMRCCHQQKWSASSTYTCN